MTSRTTCKDGEYMSPCYAVPGPRSCPGLLCAAMLPTLPCCQSRSPLDQGNLTANLHGAVYVQHRQCQDAGACCCQALRRQGTATAVAERAGRLWVFLHVDPHDGRCCTNRKRISCCPPCTRWHAEARALASLLHSALQEPSAAAARSLAARPAQHWLGGAGRATALQLLQLARHLIGGPELVLRTKK